jgi:tetratricopeptide (TPR) repeat protein
MTPIFLAATVMLIVLLLLVLWPLQRATAKSMNRLRTAVETIKSLNETRAANSVDQEQSVRLRPAIDELLSATAELARRRTWPGIYTMVAVIIFVPLLAAAMYRWVGTSHREDLATAPALAGGSDVAAPPIDHGSDMQAAIAKLAEKLREKPNDADGWALLGRTYKAMGQYAEAREAFRRAVAVAPGDADLAREYAAAETPDPEPREMDGVQPRACAVSGSDGSEECGNAPPGKTRLIVRVALDPKFKDRVAPEDTLFVFAKAAQGPKMPLAIMRLTAAQLPASVTLTDGMGMVPNLTLSQFPQVVLGARVSKSGNAVAQHGDLQTLSATVATNQAEPVQLTIDQKVD